MQNRAIRRAVRERLKKKRAAYHGGINTRTPDSRDKVLGLLVDTPTPCSCYMCGNPRRQAFNQKSRLTLQERRFMAREKVTSHA